MTPILSDPGYATISLVKKLSTIAGILGPILVLGSLFAFIGYAIFLYQPDTQVSCQKTGISQQIDIAIHVIRQWTGREGQMYLTCPGG